MRHPRFGFECASCGTVRLEIPKDAQEFTLIRCAECHSILGHWGKIQDIFLGELGRGAFDLTNGQINKLAQPSRKSETALEMAARHVREGALRLARQRELVERLRSGGHP